MKRFTQIFSTILIVISLSSCKKQPVEYHKISYELEFFKTMVMPANFFSASASPAQDYFYENDLNNIKKQRIDYWGLKKGDKVKFNVSAKQNYWFMMRIFIDDKLVSEREVKISDDSYMMVEWYKQFGMNDYEGGWSLIEFTYN